MIDSRIKTVFEMVENFNPIDERAANAKLRLIEFLSTSNARFFAGKSEHMTASAVVLSSAGTLLHLHKLSSIWWHFCVSTDCACPVPDESQNVKWFPDAEALELTHPTYRNALLAAHSYEVERPR